MARSSTARQRTRSAPTTHWAQLRLAAQAATTRDPDARAAFQAFCQRYWSVVYGVIRRKHRDARAQDLTQQFFLEHLIEGEDLAKLHPERGRFRNWLGTTLQRFLIDALRGSTRQKRDYRVERPFEDAEHELGVSASDYERIYACTLTERAIHALHARWAPKLARRSFQAEPGQLLRWLIDRDVAAMAETLAVRPDNARQLLHRLHGDLGRALRAEVADTVDDEDLESELEEICRILGIQRPEPE